MHSSNQRTKSRKHYLTFAKLKITSLFYTALLVMVVFPCVLNAQTAPNVSYGTVPNNFINSAIAPINSANIGGTVNSGTYRNVTTFAGTGTAGATDNSNPLLASFNGPKGIVKDLLGNYYVAEETGNKIRKIAANGAVTLVVSVGANVYDITINSANGDLYYTTVNDVICKLANTNAANYPAQNPTYVNAVTIVAGSTAGFTNATGTGAKFNTPVGIAMAPDNSYLLIADQANHRIRKMTLPGYVVTTFAGTGTVGGSDAAATAATFYNPVDVIFASSTLVYVGEGQNGCRVRKIENDTVTTLAGNSSGTYLSTTGFNDGTGTEAFMKYAFGLTIDNDGNLYVAETSNFKIRKITPSGVVSTIAGTLDVISGSTDAIGNNARFLYPEGVYFDKEGGFLLVCDKGNHKIRKIDLSGFAITPPLTAGLSIDSGTGIISGTPTAYSLATQYQNNFNSAEIGATANGGVPSSTGDATFKGELLLLTPKLGSKLGGFEIPATGINSNLLKVNFKLITEKTTGGADGLSYSFAPDASATATAPSAEIGTGTKLSISFADYGTSNRGVRLYYNPSIGTLNTTINTTLLAYSNNTSWIGKTAVVAINIDDLGKLTLTLDGVVLFNNIQLPDDYLAADKATWKHVFKAKTGGSNDTHALDDVSIQQGYGSTNYTVTASNGYGASVTNVAILVAEPLTVSTTAAIQVTGASAISGGVINSASLGLVTQRGMVWGTTNNPTLTSNAGMTTQGVGTTFTSSITGLLGLTTYYARAYATSLSGTVYGSEISFTTLISPPNIDYASLSNTFVKDTAIIPLNATNTGGAIVGTTVSTFAGGGNHYSMGDGTGTNATFAAPNSIGFDASGNMYVSEYGFNEIRKISPLGVVTTLVINNNPFTYLAGIAVTPSGIVYAADYSNRQIYKINPDGTVIYFAGSGLGGSLDGTGLAATFSYPESITLDASENLYVADGTTVRKITPAGVVTTLAGSYMSGTADGTGSAAQFTNLMGIAITTSGTIYVTEGNKNTIRKITPSGVVTTLAGSTQGFADGTGSAAQFYSPRGIAVAASGTIYVADSYNHRIRMITPAGMVTTLAGSTPGFADGTLSISQFDAPAGITLGASGSIYVADYNNRRIRKIEVSGYTISPILPAGLSFDATTGAISGTPTVANPATTYTITATNAGGSSVKTIAITVLPMNPPAISYTTPNTFLINTAITPLNPLNTGGAVGGTTIVSTFAGSGAAGAVDGNGTNAQFSKPVNFAFDGLGNMYVLDFNNNKIRKVTPAGVVTTFAQGVSGPIGIAVTAAGIVYVSEFDTQKIRKIMPDGTISDFAGNSLFLGYSDGVGVAASFDYPNYIALDASENLYVTDDNRIRKITPAGVVSTISYNVFGPVYSGPFGSLTGIAVSSSGTIYVADVTNNNIRKISPGGEVTTLAGSLVGTLGFADGIGNAAQFDSPLGIVLDPTESSLYVTDYNNNKIRKILVNGVVTTLAGSTLGFADGNSIAAQFNGVRGIGVNAGSIYVADSFNNRIRKIEDSGYTISPSLPAGLSFDATTGAISGTPTVANPVTNYTITATNAGGVSSFTTSIAVASPAPTWNGTEWINGPVTANTPAFIEENYTSVGTLEVGELTVKNNAAVVFQSGHNLTINGKLTVETGSTLTLENNANLVQTTDVANSGVISIKRNTAALKLLDYVLWSSPVAGQQLQSFSPATLSNRFYTYNSGTNLYNAVVSPSADTFTAGTGYLIRMPNDHATTPTIWTGKFTGIPNNGAVNLAVTSGTYNAMGNPYPSTLNADAFIDANGITEALYFWRKTNNSANPSYATYTKAGGVGTANSADPLGLIPNGVIQVGQGFIAKTTSSTTSFTNAMRTSNNGNQFLRTKNTDKSRIWLNLTNASGFFSQALVAYMDGATSGVDAAIDGRYFNDSKTALTSIINDEEFSIQGRGAFDTSDVVPLGFKTETAGDFTLAIDHTDGLFATGQKVFLKDNITNILHDLSTGSYAFTSVAGVFNTRFEFRYQQSLGTVDNELVSNSIVVYKQNDKIKIDAGTQTIAGVKVYDVSGRLLVERKDINANTALVTVNGVTQVLLVHVITQEGSVVIKKIIQ